ncbi:GntR family transcriptional regulator [Pigmentiphaga sp.]|uniref:GntR family transcriptional regulator n=1 Tax=Pigmentiphaga sp. TaxID=1977564 RepID=UPI00128D3ECC|nr:GntR family transcriptional regulator [Pigmentiphaga sp.]MPS27824.1 GntR family transcriptional regulator [Alcaligenaceae bacterium SAGV5]MPS50997.1 GntR family transcriptional regulator [Alcaligenaceae bacterium SAGV3]MPT55814.1 GntR family transcriptional regulator [Alcaligenaceae bacterium]
MALDSLLLRSPPNLTSLPEQVAEAIAEAIMKNEIAPGASLREIPLAGYFGVSRSSVREAFRILERDGVVSIQPRHGAKVTALSHDEMVEIYQIRAALLGVACDLFARCRTDALLRRLEDTLARMSALDGADEQAQALEHAALSASMAQLICEHCGNKKLASMLNQMSLQIARYTNLGLSAASRRRQSLDNWRDLLAALRKQDQDTANRCGQKLVHDNLAYALSVLAP